MDFQFIQILQKANFYKNTNNTSLSHVEIFDLSGKLLVTQNISNNESISTSSFSSGMYLVALETTTGDRFNTKLIVE